METCPLWSLSSGSPILPSVNSWKGHGLCLSQHSSSHTLCARLKPIAIDRHSLPGWQHCLRRSTQPSIANSSIYSSWNYDIDNCPCIQYIQFYLSHSTLYSSATKYSAVPSVPHLAYRQHHHQLRWARLPRYLLTIPGCERQLATELESIVVLLQH